MSENIEVLFLHVPKFSSYYKPLDEFMNITYIPMGVFALADLVARKKHCVEILHAGIEWILDRNFSIVEYIKKQKKLKVVFMPLFWHYQSYDVINMAEKIKKARPDVYVFLGGFTASYFAEQITENFEFIDGVMKGYSEKPMDILCDKIMKPAGGAVNFNGVPNLVLSSRHNNQESIAAAVNSKSCPDSGDSKCDYFITSQAEFDSLRFSNIGLLRNFHYYAKLFSFPLAYSKNLSQSENIRLNNMGLKMFPVEIGRGCSTSCTWCAGSAPNQKKMNFKAVVLWRNPEKVADTMEEALLFGYKTFAVCFDPEPEKQEYYLELFEVIRRRNIKCGLYFECYALPTARFIESFKNTFELDKSVIAISPECGNEEIRRKNKGFYFSNDEFYKILDVLQKNKIKTDVFFTMGIPNENINTLYDTQRMIKTIDSRYDNIGRMMTWGIQTEPGAPLFEKPEFFNAVTDRKTFMDFYKIHSGANSDTYSALGYSIKNYFLDGKTYSPEEFSEKIMQIKCRDFCFLHNDCASYNMPFAGRLTCKLRALGFWLKGFGKNRYLNMKRPEFK